MTTRHEMTLDANAGRQTTYTVRRNGRPIGAIVKPTITGGAWIARRGRRMADSTVIGTFSHCSRAMDAVIAAHDAATA